MCSQLHAHASRPAAPRPQCTGAPPQARPPPLPSPPATLRCGPLRPPSLSPPCLSPPSRRPRQAHLPSEGACRAPPPGHSQSPAPGGRPLGVCRSQRPPWNDEGCRVGAGKGSSAGHGPLAAPNHLQAVGDIRPRPDGPPPALSRLASAGAAPATPLPNTTRVHSPTHPPALVHTATRPHSTDTSAHTYTVPLTSRPQGTASG